MLDIDGLIERELNQMDIEEVPDEFLIARIPLANGAFRELHGRSARNYINGPEGDSRYMGIKINKLRQAWLAEWCRMTALITARLAQHGM